MYGCESQNIKKAEGWRIHAFELWCWRKLLRVPWTARRSNQSNLKEVSPEYSLEGLILKLKLQYFGHLMQRTDSLENTLMLGKTEGKRRRGRQRMRWVGWHHWLDGQEFDQGLGVDDGQGSLACCSLLCRKESDTTEQLNRTEPKTRLLGDVVKNLLANAGDVGGMGSIPGLGRSPRGGDGNLVQYSCLDFPMERSLMDHSPWGHTESDMTEAT